MSAQPANTSINVYVNVRAMRNARKHDSIASIINRLRPLIMNVPGRDMKTATYLTFDATTKDFSEYTRSGPGFPIVKGLYGDLPFATAQESLTGVDFAFQIGPDKFIPPTLAGLSGDIQGNLRTVEDSSRVTNEQV